MKSLLVVLILLVPSLVAMARPVVGDLSAQELFDKADLVVVAGPVSTKDTSEQRILPGMEYAGAQVIGVETTLRVAVVFKGKKSIKSFVLHHYRLRFGNAGAVVVDGPSLLHFDPKGDYNGVYLLYLVREPDGRYAPASGQVDPAITSVQELWQANHWEDAKAWRDELRAKHN